MSIVVKCPLCEKPSARADPYAGQRMPCVACQAGLAALLVLVLVGGFVVALLLPGIRAARESGRKAVRTNNLHQIALALHAHESRYSYFPPACETDPKGRPMCSWRVAILPFLGEESLHRSYDRKEPWHSPENLAMASQMPKVFHCPSDTEADDNETSYVMITGKGTVGGEPGKVGTRFAQIMDGASRTLLVVEVPGLHIPWTEPRDITVEELLERMESSQASSVGGFNVALCDGSVQFVPVTIDREKLRRLALCNTGLPKDLDF